MSAVLDAINALSGGSVKLATDQGTLVTAQAAVVAAQTEVDADAQSITAEDTTLSLALQASGPRFVINPADGSASFYTYSTLPPGFTIVVAQPA